MAIALRDKLRLMLRRVPLGRMTSALAEVKRHHLPITLEQLEQHHRAGGNVEALLQAAIDAPRDNLEENLPKLFSADLRGLDLNDFVARGFMTDAELEYRSVKNLAQHNPETAARYRQRLLDDIASLDAAERRYAESDLPDNYKKTAAKSFPIKREQLQQELTELELKFPQITTPLSESA